MVVQATLEIAPQKFAQFGQETFIRGRVAGERGQHQGAKPVFPFLQLTHRAYSLSVGKGYRLGRSSRGFRFYHACVKA